MASGRLPRGKSSRAERLRVHPATRAAKRAWPLLLEAKRRWDRLTPEQQRQYRQRAADYVRRGRETLPRRRKP
jgi:acyl-CoA reductase-like NAD-dependent aldehyde dehydrogenase